MTSATDELRRLLDERGVEHRFNERTKVFEWHFDGTDGEGSAHATEVDGGINIIACSLTPQQAIDATLGRGTCHAVFEVDAMSEDERIGEYVCSECGETFGDGRDQRPRYCPNCGRKVVEP